VAVISDAVTGDAGTANRSLRHAARGINLHRANFKY
jgi:hypothetical protein